VNLGHYFRSIRRRAQPEPEDDFDGCALDFTKPYDGPPVVLTPEPPPDGLAVPEPGADRGA